MHQKGQTVISEKSPKPGEYIARLITILEVYTFTALAYMHILKLLTKM